MDRNLIFYLNMTLEILKLDKEHIERTLRTAMSSRDRKGLLEEHRKLREQIKAQEYAAKFFGQIYRNVVVK